MNAKSFNIVLPGELVKKVDRAAKKEYRNRSELIREAVWIYLKDRGTWDKIFRAGEEAGRRLGIKSEADVDRIVYAYRHGRSAKKGRS